MRKVGVAVVGLGFMGKMHLGVYAKSRAAEIVAVCDVDERRLKGDLASISGNIRNERGAEVDFSQIQATADFKAVLQNPRVEMVDICLPTFLHKKYSVVALAAGKHVLCEKPMALSTAEADEILAAWKKAKTLYMVAHCIRFWPEYVYAKEAVATKKYGKVISATFRRVGAMPAWSWQNWLVSTKRSGGMALDLHIHDADYVAYLFGMPRKVFASTPKTTRGAWMTTLYDYGPALHVSAEGGWVRPPSFGFSMSFVIHCEEAVIEYNSSSGRPLTVHRNNGTTEHPPLDERDGYTREIESFLRCIIDGRRPEIVTPEDARNAVRLVEAELRSAASRKPVAVSKG